MLRQEQKHSLALLLWEYEEMYNYYLWLKSCSKLEYTA